MSVHPTRLKVREAVSLHGILGSSLAAERLMGIERGMEWQGLLLAECARHRSRAFPAKELAYVEYVETAPWNWEMKTIGQEPRYRGVGPQLIELAARWSDQLGFKGRLGLHSLPQAESFDRDRCRMTDFGLDPGYENLRYFEMTDTRAKKYLSGDGP